MNLDIDQNFNQFITIRFFKAKETEKLWHETIKKLPNGIILYNIDQDEIIFENEQLKDIFSFKQNIEQHDN